MTLHIGQRLNQYEILGLLGEGGMAHVYRAQQSTVGRQVAIKVINIEFAKDDSFRARFEREAHTVAALSHPHILKLFDFGQQEDVSYLVMELMTGGSLKGVLDGGRLPLPKISHLLDQVADALDYAHTQGVIHRDLKPHNVMLDASGNAFLTDFGLARMLNRQTQHSESGLMVGTIGYVSPEQWRGEPATAFSDLYALGIMLFEMIAGKRPFDSDSVHGVMYAHLIKPPPLDELPNDLPLGVPKIIERALAKSPEARFPTASVLATEFREALQGKMPDWKLVDATPTLDESFELRSIQRTVPIPGSATVTATGANSTTIVTTANNRRPTVGLILGLVSTAALTIVATIVLLAFLRSGAGNVPPPIPPSLTPLIGGQSTTGTPRPGIINDQPQPTMIPVNADEYAVLVAFLDRPGTPATMTRWVSDNLHNTIEDVPTSKFKIRVYPPPTLVMTNTDARDVTKKTHAVVIVWGTLDDAGGDLNIQLGDYGIFAQTAIAEDMLRRVTDVRVHITNITTQSIRLAVLNVLKQAFTAQSNYKAVQQIQDIAVRGADLSTNDLPATFVDFGVDSQISANVVKASIYSDHNFQQGIDAITQAIALDSKNPLLYIDRARFYQALGQPDKVKQDLDMARTFGPPGWTLPDVNQLF